MASSSPALARRSTLMLLPAMVRIAWWRLKQMWRVLLVTWLGMISMVVLICSVPLFTQVSNTAGLRAALADVPVSQQRITVSFASMHPTSAQILQVQQQINQEVQSNLGSYINGNTHLSVTLPPLSLETGAGQGNSASSRSANGSNQLMIITGYELDKVGSELTLLQGRLPALVSNQIEIALTQAEASKLKVGVGSTITASFPDSVGTVTWTLHVVGIFATNQNWEYSNNFQAQTNPGGTSYPVLASSATLLPQIASLQITLPNNQLFGRGSGSIVQGAPSGSEVVGKNPFFNLDWSYPFNISHVDANQLGALGHSASNLSSQMSNDLQNVSGAAPFQQSPSGALFQIIDAYAQNIAIAAIPITALLILIVALVLFLVSTMSVALVERQVATIATLRSRGATRRHVFGAFVAQGIGLGLLALLLGPFVALLLVTRLVHLLLPAADQSSLNVLTNNPFLEALSVGWFALAAVACAVLTVIIAIRRATQMDVLAFRRESTRSTRQPFWRRLNLDIIGIVLLCLGYAGYLYLSRSAITQQLGSGILALQGLMALIAPFLASAVCFTLFLRLFPLCMRLGARLAARNRKAPAVLAIAQMERAPRPAARMILLLSLIISTTMFILAYTTTQQQRIVDSANFAVGADFSGQSSANPHQTLAQQTAAYRATHGVISATPGYTADVPSKPPPTINIVAPDAATYAGTAIWTSQYSNQSLSNLMSLLIAHRSDASNSDTLDVIIDDAMAKTNNLSVGSSFILPTADGYTMHAVVVAQVHAIPGVYDSSSYKTDNVGVLCDYQSYAAVYAKNSGNTLNSNFVWLKTNNDASSLNSVHHAYPALQDRSTLLSTDETNPLYINVIGVLDLSIATALLLAVIGVLYFAWLNAQGRLTNFAVLRALGMAPRQIAAVLFWEQGAIYVTALALGLVLGLFLLTFVGPALTFTDVVTAHVSGNSIYPLPTLLVAPTRLIIGLLGALALICGIALALMARLVSRPSLGQVLRLNED